jgi:hypothetical protein
MKRGIFAVAIACLLLQVGSAAATDEELHAKVEGGFVRITAGERPVLVYRYEGASRPYVKELYTPGGVQVLLDSPPDHVHHHGLMFALGVNDVNFWEESDKSGQEVSRSIKTFAERPDEKEDIYRTAIISQEVEWRSGGSRPLLQESRRIVVYGGQQVAEAGATLLTWQTVLELPTGVTEAALTGSHYFGLGLRFVRSMDKHGTFITPEKVDGEVVRGDERLFPGRWCAYTGSVDGQPVTVAMFDWPHAHPPVTWFTMKDPFAYLSATLKLHAKPITLEEGHPLELLYGVAAWDHQAEPAEIDKVYHLWLKRQTGRR